MGPKSGHYHSAVLVRSTVYPRRSVSLGEVGNVLVEGKALTQTKSCTRLFQGHLNRVFQIEGDLGKVILFSSSTLAQSAYEVDFFVILSDPLSFSSSGNVLSIGLSAMSSFRNFVVVVNKPWC